MTAVAEKAQARDLEADLAICEAAKPGSLNPDCKECGGTGRCEICHDPYATVCCFACYMFDLEQSAEFANEARTGWPYAIRRAIAAEEEIDRLRNELNILQQQVHGSEVYEP